MLLDEDLGIEKGIEEVDLGERFVLMQATWEVTCIELGGVCCICHGVII